MPAKKSAPQRALSVTVRKPKAKTRWTNEQRAQRAESEQYKSRTGLSRSKTGSSAAGSARSGRPSSERSSDRFERSSDRRTQRPEGSGGYSRTRNDDRTDRNDRAPRSDRPWREDRREGANRFDRNDRPARNDRFDRGERTDRPRRDDRDSRGARDTGGFRGNRFDRTERPAHGDRFNRSDRTERSERNDRFDRTDRPRRDDRFGSTRNDRADRPNRFEDRDFSRKPRRDGDRSWDARPQRDDNKRSFTDSKPVRENSWQDRPNHAEFVDEVAEKFEAQVTEAQTEETPSFADLGLGTGIVETLAEMGAAKPFAIQTATIPQVIAGLDVLGRASTGSGKTIAFAAGIVERMLNLGINQNRKNGRAPRALILAPTRELALQLDKTVQPLARRVGLFTTQIYGGVPQQKQVLALNKGVDIVIGTPGRIEDLVDQGKLDLSHVIITVLDEADQMCDLGFLEPVQRILRLTDQKSQRLLFSATLDKAVEQLVEEFLKDPQIHEIAGTGQSGADNQHLVLLLDQREKIDVLCDLIEGRDKVMVFSRTRAFAETLSEELIDRGIPATALHGDLNQAKRTRNLERFSNGRVQVLVATDVAARGIHIDDVPLVVQADAPDEYKTYLHRSGRTGRAGKKGTVVTLVNRNRHRKIDELLQRAEITAERFHVRAGDDFSSIAP